MKCIPCAGSLSDSKEEDKERNIDEQNEDTHALKVNQNETRNGNSGCDQEKDEEKYDDPEVIFCHVVFQILHFTSSFHLIS